MRIGGGRGVYETPQALDFGFCAHKEVGLQAHINGGEGNLTNMGLHTNGLMHKFFGVLNERLAIFLTVPKPAQGWYCLGPYPACGGKGRGEYGSESLQRHE